MRIDLNLKRRGERELWIQRGNGLGRIDWRKIRYHLLHSVRLVHRTGIMGKEEEVELGGTKMEITMLELLVRITMIDITIRIKMKMRRKICMGMEMEMERKEIQVSLRSKGINYRYLLLLLLNLNITVKTRGCRTLSFLHHLLQVKEVTRIMARDPFTLLGNIN